nr:MAG TPA: hypothetical protein [Caudoviricetes sp.]
MTSSQTSSECCVNTLLGAAEDDEGTVVKCTCGRYWKRQKGWRALGVFEIERLRKMRRL